MKNLCMAVLVGVLGVSTDIQADIYKYVDGDGRVFYTDKPPHKKYRNISQAPLKNNSSAFRLLRRNKRRYTGIIAAAAHKYRLDVNLIHAVIRAESAYNAQAVSKAGAVGLMQLMPATAKQYGALSRIDPRQNVFAGTRYLKYLVGLFPHNLSLAIAAYNAGESAVKRYKNTIPPYPETQNYVRKVLRFYKKRNV